MALNTLIVGLLVCGLVATAIAYAEFNAWHGLYRLALYAAAGLITSELIAAPVLWEWLGRRTDLIESLAMATALAVGLHQSCKFAVERGQDAD